MGLDMYLLAIPKIKGVSLDEFKWAERHLSRLAKEAPILYEKVKSYIKIGEPWVGLRTEVAYWRKANHIHHWFVENVQEGEDDCRNYEVKPNQIEALYNLCDCIIKGDIRPWEGLPTMPGFFFGSLDYDSYYFHEIKRTHELLGRILESDFFEQNYLIYLSDW